MLGGHGGDQEEDGAAGGLKVWFRDDVSVLMC